MKIMISQSTSLKPKKSKMSNLFIIQLTRLSNIYLLSKSQNNSHISPKIIFTNFLSEMDIKVEIEKGRTINKVNFKINFNQPNNALELNATYLEI